MPGIVNYAEVIDRMQAGGFVSLYPQSGAFGFPPGPDVQNAGWIGAEDASLRPAARAIATMVTPPIEKNLSAVIAKRWPGELAGPAWLMPKSHWHYELHFGNRALLEPLLMSIGIDVEQLRDRNDGSAIEFNADDRGLLYRAVETLLGGLAGSDFLIAWPDATVACTIHHHKQLWMQKLQR